jgi:hypothetical protein
MKKIGYEIGVGKSGDWKWRVLDADVFVEKGNCDGSFQDAVDEAREAIARLSKQPTASALEDLA